MTSLPQKLYRRVNGETAFKNHLYGLLWFRSPHYFHDDKGEPQYDPTEGLGSYTWGGMHEIDVSDDNTGVQPRFLLSFSETIEATDKFKNGLSYILGLKDPPRFAKFIEQKLIIQTDSNAIDVEWGKVTYDRIEDTGRRLSPVEEYYRKHFSKPKRFEDEEEWRLLITFTRLRLFNKTIKISFPDKIREFWEWPLKDAGK